MNKEKIIKVVKFLLDNRNLRKKDSFELRGVSLEASGVDLASCESILIYLDREDLATVKVFNPTRGTDLEELDLGPQFRYSDKTSYHLSTEPIRVTIKENNLSKLRIAGHLDQIPEEIKHKWEVDLKERKATLILPDGKSLIFNDGKFGFLNPLFVHFNEDVKRQAIRESIKANSRGEAKNLELNIANQKAYLKRRVPFFDYFEIKFFPPDNYRLKNKK